MVQGGYFPIYDVGRHKAVLCIYPLFSCLTFGAFVIVYVVVFSLRCSWVMAFVINKSLISRKSMLAPMLMVALPPQSLLLIVSWLWMPEDDVYGGVVLAMFLSVTLCVVVGRLFWCLNLSRMRSLLLPKRYSAAHVYSWSTENYSSSLVIEPLIWTFEDILAV